MDKECSQLSDMSFNALALLGNEAILELELIILDKSSDSNIFATKQFLDHVKVFSTTNKMWKLGYQQRLEKMMDLDIINHLDDIDETVESLAIAIDKIEKSAELLTKEMLISVQKKVIYLTSVFYDADIKSLISSKIGRSFKING